MKAAEGQDSATRSVAGVEFMHLDQQGKNVKLLASGRVPADDNLLDKYRDIVGQIGQRPPFRNPLFKAALIQALLRNKPWWKELLQLFMSRDWRFFFPNRASPLPGRMRAVGELNARGPFWGDAEEQIEVCRRRLTEWRTTMASKSNLPANYEPLEYWLPGLVNRIVRTTVRRRAEQKTNITIPDNPDWSKVPPRFLEERESIARALFLEFRARRDRAFLDHFSQALFLPTQRLSDHEFEQLSGVLLDDRYVDDLKALTLVALLINS